MNIEQCTQQLKNYVRSLSHCYWECHKCHTPGKTNRNSAKLNFNKYTLFEIATFVWHAKYCSPIPQINEIFFFLGKVTSFEQILNDKIIKILHERRISSIISISEYANIKKWIKLMLWRTAFARNKRTYGSIRRLTIVSYSINYFR